MANEMYNLNPSTDADPAHGFATRAYSASYLAGLYASKHAWKKLRNETSEAGFGESVTLGVMPRFVAKDVNISTGAFNYSDDSVLAATIVLDKQKAVGFSLPAAVMAQSKVNVQEAFSQAAGMSLADSIDAELSKLFASMTTNSAGSLGADISDAYISQALEKLVTQYVPIDKPEDLVIVLPSSQFAATKALKNYTSYRINAGSTNTDGGADVRAMVDTIYGIDVVYRADSALELTGGKYGAIMHRDAVGVAISKQFSTRPPQFLQGSTNIEMVASGIFGISILDKKRCCLIKCK
jgi:hypothetical protein